MTFSDLLDQAQYDAGDDDGSYRNSARRWLNLARAEIGNECLWATALRPEATITTASGTEIYSVEDAATAPDGIEFIWGDTLADQTNNLTISHDTLGTGFRADPDQTVTGPPTIWSDAGATSAGVRQIRMWPIPDGTYTIQFPAYVRMVDVDGDDDGLSVDPFFGAILPWSSTFAAGMRFFHDLNNNEDAGQIQLSEIRFRRLVRQRKSQNRMSLAGGTRLQVVNTRVLEAVGRFDPAHYSNG